MGITLGVAAFELPAEITHRVVVSRDRSASPNTSR
jgi:hypothetical protein